MVGILVRIRHEGTLGTVLGMRILLVSCALHYLRGWYCAYSMAKVHVNVHKGDSENSVTDVELQATNREG